MNRNCIIFIFLLLNNSAFAQIEELQVPKVPYGVKPELKGNVASVDTRTYRHGPGSESKWYFNQVVLSFDGNGNLIEKNQVTAGILYKMTYDSFGNLIESIYYQFDTIPFTKMLAEYGDKEIIQLFYDNQNKLTDSISYLKNDKNDIYELRGFRGSFQNPSQIETFQHDSLGNITEIKWIGSNGNLIHTMNYRYDEKGRLSKYFKYKAKGVLTESIEYEYDDFGNVISVIDKDGEKTIFEYEYDEQGNWIMCVRTKNEVRYIDIRKITYY